MVFLVKLGELTLKKGNRKFFMKKLLENARCALKGTASRVVLQGERVYVHCEREQANTVEEALSHLIGIAGFAQTQICSGDNADALMQTVKEATRDLAKTLVASGKKSFKIEAKRVNKNFEYSSYQIACATADFVLETIPLKVDVHTPDFTIYVEVRKQAYVYATAKKGNRGLPVGVSGKGLLLLSGGIDSPVAGYRMLCRGMSIECVYFHSYPYTPEEAQHKVEVLAKTLALYANSLTLHVVSFTEVQKNILKNAPQDYATILLRLAMMQASVEIAKQVNAKALITGESLGQVASQTLENITVVHSASLLPVLCPLIGMDKEEITNIAQKIGTYETSILPYEDCCVLFAPEHPVLKARREETMQIYDSLQLDCMIKTAVDTRLEMKF